MHKDNSKYSDPNQDCESSVEREKTLKPQEVIEKNELDQITIGDLTNRRIIKAHHKLKSSDNFEIANEDEQKDVKIVKDRVWFS